MKLPLRPVVLAFTMIGCSGSTQPDAGVTADAARVTDGAVDAPPADAVADAPPASADLRVVPSGLPLPAGVAPPLRILDGKATVTGDGASGCSNQTPPSGNGDRWCAFAVSGATAGTAELWVMNVTRAAATGQVPACDGSGPDCLRLTSTLWTASPIDGPAHPYAHAFDGDNLIFYADSNSTSAELHHGPIYVWRPGWARARQIASDKGLLCAGHPLAPLAYCLDNVVGDPLKPDSVELRAGSVADPAGALLPSVDHFRPHTADGTVAWQVGFSPDGALLGISSPDPDPMVEALRVVATSDLGVAPPKEILRDVGTWTVSSDGKKVFFLRAAAGAPSEDLYAADLPTGANATTLGTKVTGYRIAGEGPTAQGVGFFTGPSPSGLTSFALVPDTATPASARTLFSFQDNFEDLRVSPDGRFTVWRNSQLQARLVRHADVSSCLLNIDDGLQATLPRFLSSAGLVFWTETIIDGLDRQDAFYATPDGCQAKTRYAQAIYQVNAPVADRGLIFGDEYDQETVTLKYAGADHQGADWRLKPPVRISEKAKPAVVLVGADPLLLLFHKQEAGNQSATYLFGPVPF